MLPVHDVRSLAPDRVVACGSKDGTLHLGAITITPGGFLDLGARGVSGRH